MGAGCSGSSATAVDENANRPVTPNVDGDAPRRRQRPKSPVIDTRQSRGEQSEARVGTNEERINNRGGGPVVAESTPRPVSSIIPTVHPILEEPGTSGAIAPRPALKRSPSVERRLETFKHWPVWAAFPALPLAEQGYSFTGKYDCVHCESCELKWMTMDPTDEDPLFSHLRKSPDCPTLNRLIEANPSLLNKRTEHPDTGIPRDEDFWQRMKSYISWPVWADQRPHDLATYGYTFSGQRDIVVCSSCHVRVMNWERNDDVFLSLARHTPTCCFVIASFGNRPEEGKWGLLAEEQVAVRAKHPGFWLRWDSYQSWPRSARVSPVTLIQNGFMYTHEDDVVVCQTCSARRGQWKEKHDVSTRHREAGGAGCAFLRSLAEITRPTDAVSALPPLKAQLAQFAGAQASATRTEDAVGPPLCNICIMKRPTVVLQPCKHVVVCAGCARSLIDCPVCRQPINDKEALLYCGEKSAADILRCLICTSRDVCRMLEPCRHLSVCDQCFDVANCPYCNAKVLNSQRLFLSQS